MYLVLEYATYLAILAVLAGLLFGASVLAIVTKAKAPAIAEASRKAVHDAARRIEETDLLAHLPGRSTPDSREV